MAWAEILDGPPEWAGTQFESPEVDLADEIGLSHPRWRGTPVRVGPGALYAYRKVEVAGDRHRYRYVGPYGMGTRPRRLYHGVEDLTGWDVLVVQKELHSNDRRKLWGSPVRVYAARHAPPQPGSGARGAGLAGADQGRHAAPAAGAGHRRVLPGAAGPPDG